MKSDNEEPCVSSLLYIIGHERKTKPEVPKGQPDYNHVEGEWEEETETCENVAAHK